MPTRACVKCRIALHPKKTGAYMIVMAFKPPQPYQIWACDVWACKSCGMEVATGFSNEHIEHYQEGFGSELERIISNPKNVIVYQYESTDVVQES